MIYKETNKNCPTSQQIKLPNIANGGMDFAYVDLLASPILNERFFEALGDWRCETYVNFNESAAFLDATCSVEINSSVPAGTKAVTGVSFTISTTQPVCQYIEWIIKYNPIYLNDTGDEIEHTFLHEIGHAHGLGHVSNSKFHMYGEMFDDTKLNSNDIKGGVHMSQFSSGNDDPCDCDYPNMILLTNDDCEITSIENVIHSVFDISNLVLDELTIYSNKEIDGYHVDLIDVTGQKRFSSVISKNQINIHNLSSGIYFLVITNKYNEIIHSEKIVKI